jgi:hypothetical protein
MEGRITIVARDVEDIGVAVTVETSIKRVDQEDKLILIRALMTAIEVDPFELSLMALSFMTSESGIDEAHHFESEKAMEEFIAHKKGEVLQ